MPPIGVLIGLGRRAIESQPDGRVVWVGRSCWPYPPALVFRGEAGGSADRRLLERSVFVDPPGRAERVWAIDLAMRSAGVSAVVADGRGLTMAESRRLQLAGEAGGAIGLIARPEEERRAISAARTRWWAEPTGETNGQAWIVELTRLKGAGLGKEGARRWVVRRDHATGDLNGWTPIDGDLACGLVDRPRASAGPKIA